MKLLFVAVAVAFVAVTLAEDCPSGNAMADCGHVSCNGGYHKACTSDNVCTCSGGAACTSQADCASSDSHCPQDQLHCVDQKCHCQGGHHGQHGGPGGPGGN